MGWRDLLTAGWKFTSTSMSPDVPDLGEAVEARMDGALLRVTSVPARDEPLVSSDAVALEKVRVIGESDVDIFPTDWSTG